MRCMFSTDGLNPFLVRNQDIDFPSKIRIHLEILYL